jgi:four helix bundle protein
MDEATFKDRTREVALRTIDLVEGLPRRAASDVVERQLLRSATSVGANYRASCRGRSIKEILAKLSIVEEEADESSYWLELLVSSGAIPETKANPSSPSSTRSLP